MTAFSTPALAATRRMTSLSKALRRQPKVTMSSPDTVLPGNKRGIDAALKNQRRRAGHHDMAVIAPADVEVAAIEGNGCLPPGQATAVRRDEGGAGAAAASTGLAGAALPDAQPDPRRVEDLGDADIGALGK